jgi:SAM-dependent methyltransferase
MEQIQPGQSSGYALGHAEDELDRIINVGRYFGDLTEHVLRLAGLAPGMRVLDVGCGPGEVVFLAARLVGPEGTVIGVDVSPEAIELARQRAAAAGLTNVHFVTQDLADAELELDEPVDAPFWSPGAAVLCRPGAGRAPADQPGEAGRAGGLPGE